MFELLSTLLRGSRARPVSAATGPVADDRLAQKITAAEAGVTVAKRALAMLVRQQRAEQTALNLLRSRSSALEDRIRQAIAAECADQAANGARALADLENASTARRQTIARLDEKVTRLRQSLARGQRRLSDLRSGAAGGEILVADDTEPLEPSVIAGKTDQWLAAGSAEDRLAAVDPLPTPRVQAEDVLARLRNTPAPTSQYTSP